MFSIPLLIIHSCDHICLVVQHLTALGMPIAIPEASRMAATSHSVSQADLEVLSLLTSDESSLGPLPSRPKHHQAKRLPRRESPMDALLISAVLSGSGPLTRHHIGHGASKFFWQRIKGNNSANFQHDQELTPHATRSHGLYPHLELHIPPLYLCAVCKRLEVNDSGPSESSHRSLLLPASPKNVLCRRRRSANDGCRWIQHQYHRS